MNKPNRLGVFLLPVAIALTFAAGWWLASSGAKSDLHIGHAHESAAAEASVWTCSMHPQVRQPEPGSCPICGMDLIPLPSDDSEEVGELPQLRVSERAATLMQIRTVPAQRKQASARFRLPGRIAVDETRLHVVSSWFAGRVDRLFVNFTGQRVAAGEPLMELYSPELFGVQEEFLQALRSAEARGDEAADRILEGARDRLRLLGLSEQQIAEIRESGKPSTHLTVSSPANGFIIERQVSAGEYVQTGTPLFTVADLSLVWAELEAFESELELLRVGQTVELELISAPGRTRRGEIAFIDPVVDPVKRTARVRVDMPNEDLALKPGMLAIGRVAAQSGSGEGDPLVIPVSAPLHTGERAVVYVQLPVFDRPTFEARDVKLGRKLGDVYAVLEGLSEGERVVVNGQFKIDSELQIRGRPSMMAPVEHRHEVAVAALEQRPLAATDLREPPKRLPFAGEIDGSFSKEVQSLIEEYLRMTEALAADDAAAAQAALEAMQAQLREIGEHRLSGEAHSSWQRHHALLHQILESMLASDTLQHHRSQLQELTTTIESVYVNFGGDALPALNRALCPMVGEGIGTWLQRGDEIRNPYYGANMLTCGEIFGGFDGRGRG